MRDRKLTRRVETNETSTLFMDLKANNRILPVQPFQSGPNFWEPHPVRYAVGTAIENATHGVRQAAGGAILLVDAVFDESLPEGAWSFFPDDQLDTVCHTAHSLALSILTSLWRQELPGLEIHFLGISIRSNTEFAGLSPALQNTLQELSA